MKPLRSQRIKHGQRILLISEKQKEEGVCVAGGGGGVPVVHFVLLWPLGKGGEMKKTEGCDKDVDSEEDRTSHDCVKKKNENKNTRE